MEIKNSAVQFIYTILPLIFFVWKSGEKYPGHVALESFRMGQFGLSRVSG